jgi:glutamate-1-semialdehyde aminotransferase
MEVAKTQLDAKTKSLEASEKQYQDLVARTTQLEEQLKRVTESVGILKGRVGAVTNRMTFFFFFTRRQTKGESWLLNSKRRLLTWKNR